ncbi:MAG: gamma-glutamylcyclotransferase family protein [Polyangiaceae bacterium]
MHWVFAYGSNMDLGDLTNWFQGKGLGNPRVLHLAVGSLPEHRLVWNYRSLSRGAGAANVEIASQSSVPGLLLQLDEATLLALDQKEGHPERYRREHLTCRVWSGEPRDAWVYRVQPEFRQPAFVAPTRGYRDLLLCAARRHGFPADYVAALESLELAD